MEITANDLLNFKALYRKYFSVELDDKAAHQKLSLLLLQISSIYWPISEEHLRSLLMNNVNEDGNYNGPKASRTD